MAQRKLKHRGECESGVPCGTGLPHILGKICIVSWIFLNVKNADLLEAKPLGAACHLHRLIVIVYYVSDC